MHVWSVTKSVVSALVGIAIDEKLIRGLDATLPELLPQYNRYLDDDEKQITLRQLMTMTAGFPGDEPVETLHELFAQRTDPIRTILTDGIQQPPGQTFVYSSRSAHLVAAVLREALIRVDPAHPLSVLDYAREKLFDPLAIDTSEAQGRQVRLDDVSYDVATRFDWATDATGLHNGCCMLRLRPADMIKFGELYLQEGIWHGRRILPAEWVRLSTNQSEVNPQYGLMWWLDTDPQGHQTWLAKGWGGQVIAVVPEHRLVVAVASVPTDAAGYIDGDAAWHLAADVVVSAVE